MAIKEENTNSRVELTLEALYDVPVQVSVVLGSTTMLLSNILLSLRLLISCCS